MPILRRLRGKTRLVLFLQEKGACFCFSFSCTARLFRRRILSSPQPIIENCGSLVRFLAPFFSLTFVVGTSHHNGAKTLLARVGAAAAKFVVTAPSGARIQEQTPLLFCFLGQSWYGYHLRSWLNKGLFHTGFCLRKTKKPPTRQPSFLSAILPVASHVCLKHVWYN